MMNINFFTSKGRMEQAKEALISKKIQYLCHRARIRSCGGSKSEYRNVMKSLSLLNTKITVIEYIERKKLCS